MYYVYEWFNTETDEVFYVGKGCGRRYKVRKHNNLFNSYLAENNCESRIVKTFDSEDDAFQFELERTFELWSIGQASCNIYAGGTGGTRSWWTEERRAQYSENNVMKSDEQRDRMRNDNPMFDKSVVSQSSHAHMRPIVVDGVEFESARKAAEALGVHEATIRAWCKAGVSSSGAKCAYADGFPTRHRRASKPRETPPYRKPVIIDDVEYASLKDAARSVGATSSNLRAAILRNGMYKNHRCRYANQQPSQGNSNSSTLEGSTTNG